MPLLSSTTHRNSDLYRCIATQSEFSLTIALDSLSEYDGGGTYFAEYGEVLNCESGGVISFRGDMFHGGHPITKGVRYILVAFLYSHLKKED